MGRLLRTFSNLFWALLLIYVPLALVSHFKSYKHEPRQVVSPPKPALPQSEPLKEQKPTTGIGPRSGEMQLLDPPRSGGIRIPGTLNRGTWRGNSTQLYNVNGKPVLCIAYGDDLKAYYANGFFKGFVPYPVDSKWKAMQYITTHVRYMLDEQQFKGYREIWLSSEETFRSGLGDCEDHAILLADWLQGMGYDARVAFGTIHNDGHAWVVLFEEGKTYLLEATDKYVRKVYPLASALPQYRPRAMFNDRYIWFNRGSDMTTRYTGENWVKTARFRPF